MPLSNENALRALSDRSMNQLRAAILEAAEELGNSLVLRDIVSALNARNPALALTRLPMERVMARLERQIAEVVRGVYEQSAQQAPLPPAAESFRDQFNIVNQEALRYINTAALNAKLKIQREIEDAVRNVVYRGFTQGIHPYDMARELRSMVGLTDFGMRAVANYSAFLNELSLDRPLSQDAMRRLMRGGVRRDGFNALARTGMTEQRKQQLIAGYKQRLMNERATVIARTVTIDASNAGQNALWRAAIRDGYLNGSQWRVGWIVAKDERTCPQCIGMSGMTREINGVYQGGVERPTLHPNCRCSEGLVRATAAAKRRTTTQFIGRVMNAPPISAATRRNPVLQSVAGQPKTLAKSIVAQARAMDPLITGRLETIAEDVGAQMEGLDYRIKTDTERIAEKIDKRVAREGLTPEKAAGEVSDALRYTMSFSTGRYNKGVKDALKALKNDGFEVVEFDNRWNGKSYKGINCTLAHESGYKFELQFHTDQSFAAKMDNHDLYKRFRGDTATAQEAKRIERQMVKRFKSVEIPPNVEALGEGR